MRVKLVADPLQVSELLPDGMTLPEGWSLGETLDEDEPADACIDLLYDDSPERLTQLFSLPATLILIHSVHGSLENLPPHVARLNGWPGFLQRPVLEAACLDPVTRMRCEEIFASLNKKISWVPDIPGFVSARIISMIINEAWFALQENVSTPGEIDTAMKLGTNYPFGPFEWGERIGIRRVWELLQTMASADSRYSPCDLLTRQVQSA